MDIGTRVKWTSYGAEFFGTVEHVQRSAIRVRQENGPMAGKLCVMLASSVKPAPKANRLFADWF